MLGGFCSVSFFLINIWLSPSLIKLYQKGTRRESHVLLANLCMVDCHLGLGTHHTHLIKISVEPLRRTILYSVIALLHFTCLCDQVCWAQKIYGKISRARLGELHD